MSAKSIATQVTTTPQSGIFALGTASHSYIELDRRTDATAVDLVRSVASLREPRTTMGGVNLVAGFRPELWAEVSPSGGSAGLHGFDRELIGAGGFTMPATQHDAVLWISGSEYDVVFDVARQAMAELQPVASVAEETSSWPYHHDRDLTGFIDGTKNPSLIDAPDVALIGEGEPGAGGSILLLQKWFHDAGSWESQTVARQEAVMGRSKPDSVELDPLPADSHVARNDQDVFGKVFRRNMPFGTVTEHGTMFVGFTSDQARLEAMLESMAGVHDGVRDALTNFTRPMTGAYYFIPSIEGLRPFIAATS